MEIKKLSKEELILSLPFVWKVFCEFEGQNYSENGKVAFYEAIHDSKYLSSLTAYGAFVKGELVGIIASRLSVQKETHIALFFVDGSFQKQGIGRKLFGKVLDDFCKLPDVQNKK